MWLKTSKQQQQSEEKKRYAYNFLANVAVDIKAHNHNTLYTHIPVVYLNGFFNFISRVKRRIFPLLLAVFADKIEITEKRMCSFLYYGN